MENKNGERKKISFYHYCLPGYLKKHKQKKGYAYRQKGGVGYFGGKGNLCVVIKTWSKIQSIKKRELGNKVPNSTFFLIEENSDRSDVQVAS